MSSIAEATAEATLDLARIVRRLCKDPGRTHIALAASCVGVADALESALRDYRKEPAAGDEAMAETARRTTDRECAREAEQACGERDLVELAQVKAEHAQAVAALAAIDELIPTDDDGSVLERVRAYVVRRTERAMFRAAALDNATVDELRAAYRELDEANERQGEIIDCQRRALLEPFPPIDDALLAELVEVVAGLERHSYAAQVEAVVDVIRKRHRLRLGIPADAEDDGAEDVPCVAPGELHVWVVSDENENVAYCEKCGKPEY